MFLTRIRKKLLKKEKNYLTRKLKHLKITINEQVINELVNFFKLKTSLRFIL